MFRTISRRIYYGFPKRVISQLAQEQNGPPITRNKIGVSLIRELEKEEERSLFPAFESLNVVTDAREHRFNVSCDRVIKFIKLGAINKIIATQYCHYLAHLARSSDHEDSEYYSKRCLDLMSYILRSSKDLPVQTRNVLICDISDTSVTNCKAVGEDALKSGYLKEFYLPELARLLGSCYKFGLWKLAQSIVGYNDKLKAINLRTIDPLVEGVIKFAERYKCSSMSKDEKQLLRSEMLEHLYLAFEMCHKHRVQFVTRHKKELIKALQDFDIEVQINPNIKITGRCTHCNSNLPLFDNRHVAMVNSAVRDLILKGSDKGLYVNTSPNDAGRFESFLHEIHNNDKKPIDCVIDGLNISYKNSMGVYFIKQQLTDDLQKTVKRRNPEAQTQVLINTIIRGNMLSQFKKILVVGKWHMTKWPGLMDFFRKNKIHFYSSFNQSQDDLFQIFASTLSHKTVLVTGDYLRDHAAQLNSQDRLLFERWIDTHQVWIDSRSLKPIMPTPYEKLPSVNRVEGYFHLPIVDKNLVLEGNELEPPPHLNKKMLTWLCCKPIAHEIN